MDPITPICKLVLAALLASASSPLVAKSDDAVNRYAAARLAEMGNRNDLALKGYTRLYREAPESAVLTDRIFDSAIRSGDMAAALKAVRAQELRGEVSAEAPLLLFADAFDRKNWPMALLATNELAARSNFGFMAPILRNWVNVAQGKPVELAVADPQADPLLAYYSNDQRIYLQLASGDYAKAKLELRSMASVGGDFVRDLMLRSAPVIAAQGDDMFADAMIASAMGTDGQFTTFAKDRRLARMNANDGLAALHVRISAALLEQNIDDHALVLARLALWYSPDSEPAKLSVAKALDAAGLRPQATAMVETIGPTSLYWLEAIKWRVTKLDDAQAVVLTRDALKRWPESVTLALLAAQSLEAAGDLTGAAAGYRKLANSTGLSETTPRQRAIYKLMLASVLDNAGDWVRARQELDAALVLDPNNAQILNYLGYSLLERNDDIARATDMVRRAYQLVPDSPAITDSMGWAHYQVGEYAQAVTLLETAAKAAGNDRAINEHLGDAYWQIGRLRDARYAWGVASQTAEADAAIRLAGKVDTGLPRR